MMYNQHPPAPAPTRKFADQLQQHCFSIRSGLALAHLFCFLVLSSQPVVGQAPVLETVFPAGGQAGQIVELTLGGKSLEEVSELRCNAPGVACKRLEPNRFSFTIPTDAQPGLYDLWAVGEQGVSAPRTFSIGSRAERLEFEPNETAKAALLIPLDVTINGRLDKAGDVDYFRFTARQRQRVVIECMAERIDSRLRAVLELFDAAGRRLMVNRGYFGIDPLIDFQVPADGEYLIKLQDLTSTGSAEHLYRLDVDTGPRVAFSLPSVIQSGREARIALYGWNLAVESSRASPTDGMELERVEIGIPETLAERNWRFPVRLQPAQAVLEGFSYHFPGSSAPLVIGVTDVPVVQDYVDNHTPSSALEIFCPCEVSGQLIAGDELDWYAIRARRGEVFYVEALAERIQSPLDLTIRVFDAAGERELAQFGDQVPSNTSPLPTGHLDPTGRWVAPADGRYLIAVQNMTGGLHADSRRAYRLSVRREEPDFQLMAVPHHTDPGGLNVQRNGRQVLDLIAFRRRGCEGPIRVTAKNLPVGVECPDIWLGPGVNQAMIVVSADQKATTLVQELKLDGYAENVGWRAVRGGTLVKSGTPTICGRLVSQIQLAVAGDAPLRITADGHEPLNHPLYGNLDVRHSPGGIVDVAVHVERRDTSHQAPVKLIGVGLPESFGNQTAVVPAGESMGYLSLYLPPTLPVGQYSLVVRAETTVLPPGAKQPETTIAYSNSVTIDVQTAAFLVQVDPFAVVRAKRGEVIQVGYSAQRRNGFIGKLHTELASPGRITNVVGLRGRGETFVGQSDKGTLQIVVNDDAPLGQQPFLRLFTVGVVEDKPQFQGSSFLSLEIVE